MGFTAGASAKGYTSTGESEGPFKAYAMLAAISAIVFVIYTFGAYRAVFGFAALGELVVGALCAGFLSQRSLVVTANLSPILLILSWIMATH